jgi:signal transduction histidine kinase
LAFAGESEHFMYREVGPNFLSVLYRCCVPLIGAEARAIGLLILRSECPFPRDRDASQAIWLYANDVARAIEVGISLETQAKLRQILAQLEKTATPKQEAIILRKSFEQLGFRRGVIKVAPLDGGTEAPSICFGVTSQEFEFIKENLSQNQKDWIKRNLKEIRGFRLIERIFYYPWRDEWVQREFSCSDLTSQNEKGFLYINGISGAQRSGFEALLGITQDMVEPTEAWTKELRLLADTMAKSVENVRLATAEAANEATRAEREWLRTDIHDVLNLIQGGPMLFSEAARSVLTSEQAIADKRGAIRLAVDEIEAIERASHFAYQSLSQLMEDLRQPTLREKGITEALWEFGKALNLESRLRINIDRKQMQRLNSQTMYALYRIAQEAINNACKHAYILNQDGGQVEVSLKLSSNNQWELIVRDNGRGFREPIEEVRARPA